MKIVDISEFYSPTSGGVRTYTEAKFLAADRLGHRLTVIAPGPEDRVETRGAGKLVWVKSPPLPFDKNYHMFWSRKPVWRILDDEVPDFIEGSSPWRGGWIAGTWPGPAPRALFMHADPVAVYPQTFLGNICSPAQIDAAFGWFWSYLRRLNSRFDGTIVAGAWLAKRFAEHGLKHLHTVPFGVDIALFSAASRSEDVRREMLRWCGLGPEATLLVTVGRHHPEKRIGLLIDAVTLAQRTCLVGLVIIGDGLSHERVRRKAARAAHIHVAGRVDDRSRLATMMASADALLHGSTAETFGFVTAEALACGTPVIVPDAGGAGDIADPAYAQIYASGNANAAADAIVRFVTRDRSVLSGAAREAGTLIGTIDYHFDKLFSFYEKMKNLSSVRLTQAYASTSNFSQDDWEWSSNEAGIR
ncbi:glycosyltransferase [Acidomonas methanolica]|uniref:glycosyltransferase n=1 Tax=Acidomonas methanolica TaxID=437 RepID=UPI0005A9C9E4|nr:glycosyltransferase [Acidomonas methanolica]MBU2654895.1 glycosyltransferase [Acidomonas methanolica]TCS29438.1 alpha-1,6-mannosyltransferase [Acidomonas methanolica]